MIILFLFSLVCCQNLIKNPSFEEVDSNNKILNWIIKEGASLSSVSHSGNKSLHWKQENELFFNYQIINVEKNYQYEACAYIKLINITKNGFQMCIETSNKTPGIFEYYYSQVFSGNYDWQQVCFTTGIIKRPNNNTRSYYLGIYTIAEIGTGGEVYIDDITLKRINFRIAINNDRDEVYDTLNVVYNIIGKEDYNLNDFDLITIIKDNKTTFYNKTTKISSFFFTKSISTKNLKLKDSSFYQVESILKNKKDNITDISFYTFKKINKIKRNVTLDKYGRMFVNDELFFPLGFYVAGTSQKDLMNLNRTRLNVILSAYLNKKSLDMIQETRQGRIKTIISLNPLYDLDTRTLTDLKEEENYKTFVNTINEFKDHPTL